MSVSRAVRLAPWILVATLVCLCLYMRFSHARDVERLSSLIVDDRGTSEVAPDTFEREARETEEIEEQELLGHARDLANLLDDANREVLSMSEVVVMQRKKIEALGRASQSVQPPVKESPPGTVERKRVDFQTDASYYRITGHTLTDPAEFGLTLEQVRPMRLAVSLSRSRDGRWLTDVRTDDGVRADVDLSVVDPKVALGGWKSRLSIGVVGGVYPDPSVSVQALYGDRFAVGPSCSVFDGGASCGLAVSWRPFSR